MRDSNRIPKVLKEIEEIWVQIPDLRLGQLLVNATINEDGAIAEMYFIEDEDLLKWLHELYDK